MCFLVKCINRALLADLEGANFSDLLESELRIGTLHFTLKTLENHAAREVEMWFTTRETFIFSIHLGKNRRFEDPQIS